MAKTLCSALPRPARQGDGGRTGAAQCDGNGVGLLFVDFPRGIRYRINGPAVVRNAPGDGGATPWPAGCPIVELTIQRAYGNCDTRVVRPRPGDGA